MKILLLTTCIYNENNYKDLIKLYTSLVNDDSEIEFHHCILFQNASENIEVNLKPSKYYTPHWSCIPDIISLSKARNFLLDECDISDYDFISFPDDDCWYPDGFWKKFRKISDRIDLFYTCFSSNPSLLPFNLTKHSVFNLVQNASSNTTIYSGDIAINIGKFDENYGVGAPNNGGEDTDFAIRAMLLSKDVIFVDDATIGHRDPLPQFKYKYYKGSLGVLKKHAFKSIMLNFMFFRKILIGFYYIVFNKIKLSDLL